MGLAHPALALWLGRVARIDLRLVPTHPGRAGGLGLLEKLPGAFALVSLALSAMLASRWAHEVLHHGAPLTAYRHAVIVFVVVWTALLLLPLLIVAALQIPLKELLLKLAKALV